MIGSESQALLCTMEEGVIIVSYRPEADDGKVKSRRSNNSGVSQSVGCLLP